MVSLGDTVVLGKWLACSRLLQGPGLQVGGEGTGLNGTSKRLGREPVPPPCRLCSLGSLNVSGLYRFLC